MIIRRLLNNSTYHSIFAISPLLTTAKRTIRAAGESSKKTENIASDVLNINPQDYQISDDLKRLLLKDGKLCKECTPIVSKMIPEMEDSILNGMEGKIMHGIKHEVEPELESKFKRLMSLCFMSGLFVGFSCGRIGRNSKN